MASQKIRIKLKAYEHNVIDQSAERIVEAAKRTRIGPHPAPHGEGDRDHTACDAQVQGLPRAV